jgi:2',3'-cyclic-nucleotide 2'-phosphodiesterase (5'-nucleotidase family)
MKTRLAVLLLIGLLATARGQETQIIIMHTNDMHASFLSHEATWMKTTPRPQVGGFVRLQQVIDSVRALGVPTLLLDAGDVMTGDPIAEIDYRGATGGALFEMMNRMGYDAWTFGNHDLDISKDNLKNLTRVASFPTLNANIVSEKGEFPLNNKPYAVFKRGGISIGVVGLMMQNLSEMVNQKNLIGLKVLSPQETAQKYIDELRPKVDLVVLLTHQGADEDQSMAGNLKGVDLIVGGHSHTRIRVPKNVNGTRVVQAGANAENLGIMRITLQGGHPVKYWEDLVQLWPDPQAKRGSIAGLVDSMQAEIMLHYKDQLTTLGEDWLRSAPGNPLANFICEAQREAAYAQVSFMNIHGVRKDLTAGPVTKKDLFEVLPFRNMLATFQFTGAQLKQVVRFFVEKHPAIVMTGMNATVRVENSSVIVDRIEVGGRAVDDAAVYVCAASDFFAGEAEKYLGIAVEKPVISETTLFSAVERAMKQQKTLQRPATYKYTPSH